MKNKHLLDIALENGFKLHQGKHLDYSSMRVNGIDSRYSHEDGRVIIWGLHEKDKPPTLIYPRLAVTDDEVNRILSTNNHIDIFNSMIK